MKWVTNEIMQDLKNILEQKKIKATVAVDDFPGGDYDTPSIHLSLDEDDAVLMCGYNPRISMKGDFKNPEHDMGYVEIRNSNSDSSGGLSYDASEDIRKLYFVAVDYFKTKKVSIIRHYNEIF